MTSRSDRSDECHDKRQDDYQHAEQEGQLGQQAHELQASENPTYRFDYLDLNVIEWLVAVDALIASTVNE